MCPQETEGSTNQNTPPSPPSTRVLEAISQYPISRHLITHLTREDVYNLARSNKNIYYTLNLQNGASHESMLARCIRTCPGPPCWGVPDGLHFIKPKEHRVLEGDPNEDMDVQMCSRKGCLRDSCKGCAIVMTNQDDAYYDFNKFLKRNRVLLEDPSCCKKPDCADYYYSCWECKAMGSLPYDGLFGYPSRVRAELQDIR
ncbi:hypothetical protein HOY82DRAFT_592875 [Tuber indicum]|nr:hypothetical protein HOY82DRAFT_592875 [Tuber indicum]